METAVQYKFTRVFAMAAVYDPGAILESGASFVVTFIEFDRLIACFLLGEHVQDARPIPARNRFYTHGTFKGVMMGLHDVRVRRSSVPPNTYLAGRRYPSRNVLFGFDAQANCVLVANIIAIDPSH